MASREQTTKLFSLFSGTANTSALNEVRPPLTARRAAKVVLALFAVTIVALIFVPWQQSLSATGRVTAFNPTLREQTVEAPITGRIRKVHVVEGQEVKGRVFDEDGNVIPGYEGTLLVSIRDPDPELLTRLKQQRKALRQKVQAAGDRVKSITNQVQSLEKSRERALEVSQKRIEMSKEQEKAAKAVLENAKAAYKLAEYQHKQQKELFKEGLTSELELQQAARQLVASKAEQDRAQVLLLKAGLSVLAFQADLDKIGFDFDASIRKATADRQKATSEFATYQAELTQLDVRISRQGMQDVYAPVDGTVFRILARGAGGGKLVNAGTPLMRIVPEIPEDQRIVELTVDGNDAPLIIELWQHMQRTGEKPKIQVRLQFEGYPAIQWVGWPSAAVGTFGGILDFVDPTDDGKGNFRILVRRDPDEEKTNPWPRGFALRQGLRVNGWVLLNQVPLGWEFWRRLNGFPPVVAESPTNQDKKGKPAVLKGVK